MAIVQPRTRGAPAAGTLLCLVDRSAEAGDVATFRFEADPALGFRAGQYLRLTLRHAVPDDRGVARNFTISSAPNEPLVAITTRLSTPPSSFKRALAGLEPGGGVEARGPLGRFVYPDDDRPAVFIAGGIGITPVRSMLVDLAGRPLRPEVTLLHANRTSDVPFRALFDTLAESWPTLRTAYTVTRPDESWSGSVGRIDETFVARHVSDLATPLFLVAGPEAMVAAMRKLLAAMGVADERVKHESFPGY
jgi:ferredoxin-NADP reductase